MRRFGLIGKTLKHSFSKNYFTQKFREEHIKDCVYESFELQSIGELPGLLTTYPDLKGLNVTIPYKEEVISYLEERNEVVQETGACNCIKIISGKLHGFNTDVIGFKKSLQPKLKPHHKKALILGSGGAAKAVKYALRELNIDHLIVSRRKETGDLGYEDVDDEILKQYTLIINTTPLGMYPNVNDDPPIPYEFITPQHFLFDLVYNPEKTKFLQHGEKQGAQVANGYEMLILQAEESWRIWNNEG
jgi:shikimate dehydrogenase